MKELKSIIFVEASKDKFSDDKLVQKLLEAGIIKSDDPESDCVYFDDAIKDKKQLEEKVRKAGIIKLEQIEKVWDDSQAKKTDYKDVQKRYHRTLGIALNNQSKEHNKELANDIINRTLKKYPEGVPITKEMIEELITEVEKEAILLIKRD